LGVDIPKRDIGIEVILVVYEGNHVVEHTCCHRYVFRWNHHMYTHDISYDGLWLLRGIRHMIARHMYAKVPVYLQPFSLNLV